MKKFAATYTETVQVSYDDFKLVRTTKIFDNSQSMQDVLIWVESLGHRNPDITDVIFSAVDGETK